MKIGVLQTGHINELLADKYPAYPVMFEQMLGPVDSSFTFAGYRVVDGELGKAEELQMIATEVVYRPVEVGVFAPAMKASNGLKTGEVGYIATVCLPWR